MKWVARVVCLALLLAALNDLVFAEERRVALPLNDVSQLELHQVTATAVRYRDSEATLIVHDLKRGAEAHGSVGLWVDNGTDGHFRNLTVHAR